MRKNLLKCPNCHVAMKESKQTAVLLTRSRASEQLWIQVAPLNVGLTVQPVSCPRCGLIMLYENRVRFRAPRNTVRAWPIRRETAIRRKPALVM
jgi:uncharacterized C2H2 Zn-finger protein